MTAKTQEALITLLQRAEDRTSKWGYATGYLTEGPAPGYHWDIHGTQRNALLRRGLIVRTRIKVRREKQPDSPPEDVEAIQLTKAGHIIARRLRTLNHLGR